MTNMDKNYLSSKRTDKLTVIRNEQKETVIRKLLLTDVPASLSFEKRVKQKYECKQIIIRGHWLATFKMIKCEPSTLVHAEFETTLQFQKCFT
jgi:hypothetical protein